MVTGLVPDEILQAWGDLPYLRQTMPQEWKSSCPRCGDSGHSNSDGTLPDRFYIITEAGDSNRTRGACRRCGYKAFANNVIREAKGVSISRTEVERLRIQAQERSQLQELEKERKVTAFISSQIWNQYHDNLAIDQRNWWQNQGIPPDWQDFWRLGYTPSLWDCGPAFTIPFFPLVGERPLTLQYRIQNRDKDKYRFEPSLGSAAFIARPDLGIEDKVVYVVEGAKKAMVVHLVGTAGKIQVVGLPSKNSSGGILPELKKASRVIFMLDPDAWYVTEGELPWPVRYCVEIGKTAYAVRLPKKIDDALLDGDISGRGLELTVRYARGYSG